MARGVDDWLVADSEDEDPFAQLPAANGSAAGHATSLDVSTIQTAVFTPDQPRTPPQHRQSPSIPADGSLFTPPGMDSTIGNFTSIPSTSGAPSEMAPKPRPRPRPRVVMKKAAPSAPSADTESTFSHISDPPISATRRTNDSIYPATATSVGLFDAIDDVYSSFDIAERAKMRSRRSQTAKKLVQPPVRTRMNEVIELTSDEDELALKSTKRQKKQADPVSMAKTQTKSRPKPRLKVKPATVLPTGSPSSQTVVQDLPAPPAQCASSPQLLASTLPTIPPSTPPQAREPTPLSSPAVTTRKRKKIHPLVFENDDEMDIISGNAPEDFPSSTLPPLFFAPPSSSVPTDSGIEIPPVESLGGRGKKRQASSGKRGTQKKTQNKGKKGKKGETTSAIDNMVEDSARLSQGPSNAVMHNSPNLAEARHSPMIGESTVTKKEKARTLDSREEDDELVLPSTSNAAHTPPADGEGQRSKENLRPDLSPQKRDPPPRDTSTPGFQARASVIPKSTPMTELIRRANSQPSSPFPNTSRTYLPFLKSSRTMLSRIAPLHPNRRTPPPPPPRPPPPKKSKKQLEMEERIEEELAETIDGWSCLADDERKALRKARIDAELGYE